MPPRQCAILVGGRGTRLGSLTERLPKPLLPIGGRPFLDFLFDEVVRRGFDEIILLAGHNAAEVHEWARANCRSEVDIKVIVEPEPLGTAGALVAAKDDLAEEFILLNGDSIFDINLLDFSMRCPSGVWVGMIALRSIGNNERYGVVELEGDIVSKFEDRPSGNIAELMNSGVYRLKRALLNFVTSTPCSLERDVFPDLAKKGLLRGSVYNGFFLDIGIAEAYEAAQYLLPEAIRRPAIFFDRDGVVNKDIGYAHRPDQIEWVDGIFDAVKSANDVGSYVFIVTNQAGVARNFYNEEAVTQLHRWMKQVFRDHGAYIDDIIYCPHHPTAGNGPYTRICDCRKPAPGMLLKLARKWPIDLSRSLLVGDKSIDLEAAHNAGVAGLLYKTGRVRDLIDVWILARREDARQTVELPCLR